MKTQLNLIYLSFLFLLSACATTHPGNTAHTLLSENNPQLKLSAYTVTDINNPAFQLIEVTFENLSESWINIEQANVVIHTPKESGLSVVQGSELSYWAEAMEFQIKKDHHNRAALQTAMLGLGGAAMVSGNSSNSESLALAGAGITAGTTIWAVADTLTYSKRKAESTSMTPDSHLHNPFAVPAKLFLRRWVLLNKPASKKIDKLVLEITADGKKGLYEVQM